MIDSLDSHGVVLVSAEMWDNGVWRSEWLMPTYWRDELDRQRFGMSRSNQHVHADVSDIDSERCPLCRAEINRQLTLDHRRLVRRLVVQPKAPGERSK